MSHIHQDETAALPELTSIPKTSRTSQFPLVSESTPLKKKRGLDSSYTSTDKGLEDVRDDISREMNGRWLGAMPIDDFLQKFVPTAEEPLPNLPENPFENVPTHGVESKRYDHFIAAVEGWMPHLQAVNTSTKGDTENRLNYKTDVSVYSSTDGVATPDRTDFSRMELWLEFKTNNNGAAFKDPRKDTDQRRFIEAGLFTPDTHDGRMARGQLAQYAGALHSQQFRHFSFSVVIQEDHARFLRWDPSATVVTAAFNYRKNPEFMAEFLWRFDHLTPEQRGHDTSVQPANLAPEVDARVREKLNIKDRDLPLYRYEIPGFTDKGFAYGRRPETENLSLASRCTRGFPAIWIPTKDTNGDADSREALSGAETDQTASQDKAKRHPSTGEREIYMKDTWRFLSNSPDVRVEAEHEIYSKLYAVNTPNIPEDVIGGDVAGGRTENQDLLNDERTIEWLCVQPKICPYQHYRLVHWIVGRVLSMFKCTKELVTAVFHALQAHAHAFEFARMLHRDISVGNIIITKEGRGLLIDWEMAKNVDDSGSRRPERTGTWQFMSANLLQNPGKLHTLTDDLESFLHVLAWTTLRYVPAIQSYDPQDRHEDLEIFDQYSVRKGGSGRGGRQKSYALGADKYPSPTYRPSRKSPISDLLKELSSPFKSFYGMQSPTPEERKKVDVPPDYSDPRLVVLWAAVRQYDEDMECLRSSTWFIDTMKTALDEKEWPDNDKGVKQLFSSGGTRVQVQRRTKQQQKTESIFTSRFSSGSKRAASVAPERSAKRLRGTPTASGSGV